MASPEGGSGIEQIQEQQGETDRRQERYVSGRDHLVEHVPYQEGDGQGGRGLRHRDGGTESQWSIGACIETRIVSPGCVAFAPERGGMTLHVISRRMVHRRPYVFAAEPIRRVPQSATATRMRRQLLALTRWRTNLENLMSFPSVPAFAGRVAQCSRYRTERASHGLRSSGGRVLDVCAMRSARGTGISVIRWSTLRGTGASTMSRRYVRVACSNRMNQRRRACARSRSQSSSLEAPLRIAMASATQRTADLEVKATPWAETCSNWSAAFSVLPDVP